MAPKPPKLTKAEKKRLKAEQAELHRRFIKKDQLAREIRLGELTLKKCERKWKDMLMRIGLPRVKEELEYVWHIFERTVDAKDFTISLLMDEVEDAEEQYMLNFRAHCSDIDRLITMFRDRLVELKEANDKELAEMKAAQEAENNDYKRNFEQDEHFFKVMMYGLEQRNKAFEKSAKSDFLSKMDEEKSKLADFLQKQRAMLEALMNAIWDEYKNLFSQHLIDTDDRRKGYLALKKGDDRMSKLLAWQLKKIQKFYEQIRKLSGMYASMRQQQGQKIRELQIERQYYSDSLTNVKHRQTKDSDRDQQLLSLVTSESTGTMDHLNRILQMGTNVLKLSQVNRQLETSNEKVMAFPETGIQPFDYDADADEENRDQDADPDRDQERNREREERLETKMAVYNELNNFWQRVAQADAIRYKLKQEREALRKENLELSRRIHSYCDCAVCIVDPQTRPSRRINVPSVVEAACVHKWLM